MTLKVRANTDVLKQPNALEVKPTAAETRVRSSEEEGLMMERIDGWGEEVTAAVCEEGTRPSHLAGTSLHITTIETSGAWSSGALRPWFTRECRRRLECRPSPYVISSHTKAQV